ncbi:levansucrase [Micromonospora sp. FIMYZ51]|uniref:levansucrase n=1 Tax=Micromonospora sp. FIMYZ51 TaxID=3051832 RepID=UPI00311EF627
MAENAVQEYITATAVRLAADGCDVQTENWHGTAVLIGYRSDFRVQWMATKLHLFTIVAPATDVTRTDAESFTTMAFEYAEARKGQWRGFQSGVAVLPALVGTRVDPAATAWVQQKQLLHFASMARPVVVDVTAGTVGCYRRTPALGFVYAAHLRRKLDTYFPAPGRQADRRDDSRAA